MNRRYILQTAMAFGAAGLTGNAAAAPRVRVPAEETPHELTFMQWPVTPEVYDDADWLDDVQDTIAKIANTIAAFEPVVMLAGAEYHASARRKLSANVTLWDVPTDDLWCRDAGPITGVDSAGNRTIRHIAFNGWGMKQTHANDGKIIPRVADRLGLPLIPTGLKGEAGGVEQDGHGLIIAHDSSWVNDNRNPDLTREQIGARLLQAYGADRILWSPGVWNEDITDYHIDSLARFTGPDRVLMNLPDKPDPQDPYHMAALDTHDMLIAAGMSVDVIPEPHKRRVKTPDFVASYVNYYVCNGAVIAPEFGDRSTDKIARDALARHYPGREVVTLNTDALGELGGGIHCATHELPA